MNTVNQFQDEVLKMLNLLYKRFLIDQPSKPTDADKIISIYPNDLSQYGFDVTSAGELICLIAKEDERIKFEGLFDEDNFAADTAQGENPSIFEIRLPADFEKVYRQLERKYRSGSDLLQINICIKKNKGIYVRGNESNRCEIGGKRFELVVSLKDGPLSGEVLASNQKQSPSLLAREIKKINERFTKDLSLNDGLVSRLRVVGYGLNREKYKIDFLGF